MISKFKKILLYAHLTLVFIFFIFPTFSESNDAKETESRTLVHLLDYLAKDYGGAVQNGKIISKLEYDEQLEFAEKCLQLTQQLNETAIIEKTKLLSKNIRDLKNEKTIETLAREIQKDILAFTKIKTYPSAWPKISNGKNLYSKSCASCHGEDGKASNALASTLNPKPISFFDDIVMSKLTAFQAYNSIRLGIPGTAMGPNPTLTDNEIWDLAFYIMSLRHGEKAHSTPLQFENALEKVSSLTDQELAKDGDVTNARLFESENESDDRYLQFVIGMIQDSKDDFNMGNRNSAKDKALRAYLEGIEPIESKIKASSIVLKDEIEEAMINYRAAIDSGTKENVEAAFSKVLATIDKIKILFNETTTSPWIIFSLTAGILLREGFEAALLLIALLGVIRATNNKRAAFFVHLGWLSAVLVGIITWFFSGWLTNISGVQRELMEGVTSLIAVLFLLYIGFWLHSKTEIKKWKSFIDDKILTALTNKNLLGVAMISFISVFREAFETVLFLRALTLENHAGNSAALFAGAATAFTIVIVIAALALKFSSKIPVRKIFSISSILMIALAFILTGKAFHAFQETGLVSITRPIFNLKLELLGLFPTVETLSAQLLVLVISFALWQYGKKQSNVSI